VRAFIAGAHYLRGFVIHDNTRAWVLYVLCPRGALCALRVDANTRYQSCTITANTVHHVIAILEHFGRFDLYAT
jgi:hypothetical protein